MSDQVKPALTPEEWGPNPTINPVFRGWASAEDSGSFALHGRVLRVTASDKRTGRAITLNVTDERHALAALALHGQPFGFTREDVGRIRNAADFYRMQGYTNQPYDLFALAARIEALLPPCPHNRWYASSVGGGPLVNNCVDCGALLPPEGV